MNGKGDMSLKINIHLQLIEKAQTRAGVLFHNDRMSVESFDLIDTALDRAAKAEMALEALRMTLGSD